MQIISIIMSLIIALSGVVAGFISGEKIPENLFSEVFSSQIEKIGDSFGFVNDLIILFMSDDAKYSDVKKIAEEVDGRIVAAVPFINKYQIKIKKTDFENLSALCEKLTEKTKVIFASPDFVFKAKDCYIPNDPWSGISNPEREWNVLNPVGSNWSMTAIDAPGAWEYSDRFGHIDLGIVDSGIEKNHEDLSGKIVFPSKYYERSCDSSDHGTHVAGIMCATGDNNIGVTGLCQNATIHFVDWEPNSSQFWFDGERILTGLLATVKDGAKVVNFSCGMDVMGDSHRYPDFVINIVGGLSSMYMASLLRRGYDFIVCQAAGNGDNSSRAIDAINNGFFCSVTEKNCKSKLFGVPKKDVLDRILVVGSAINSGNNEYYQAESSNVGPQVDICAPGAYIYSCKTNDAGKYGYMSGTSMASPLCAALCGLVWSVDKSFTGAEVAKIVCDENNTNHTAKKALTQYYDDVGYRDYKMINARLAVEAAISLSDSRK